MKKTFVLASIATMLCAAAEAQVTQPSLPPGEIAVLKAGTPNNVFNIHSSKVQPCYVQVFDTGTSNQASPLISVPLSTNSFSGVWINAHAGSEGGGISRTIDRQFLALEGYTGNILSPTNGTKPSANTNVYRGVVTLDAFTNAIGVYYDLANWFGLPPGVTQNNPTGIASTDGTNFWGTGNVTGSSAEASGTLFYNANVGATPFEIQNYIQAAGEARIIGGTLYVVVPFASGGPAAGIYNFVGTSSSAYPGQVIPLPYDPNGNPVYQTVAQTNLFLSWGSPYQNIANFDMNAAGTIAYGADQTYGIVKFTNNAGIWAQAPYYFSTTNIGTTKQPTANQGCFGICVDFSGANPVIYATTMETGTVTTNAQGNANQNRLISIVDSGNPGTNLVAVTLATATTTNENFRGIDFTPDLRPLITSAPADYSTTNRGAANFTVAAASVYALGYQWLQNGTNLNNGLFSLVTVAGATSSTLALSNLHTNLNNYTYQCVVSNAYGMVTSTPPANLTVTFLAVPPIITSATAHLTNYVGNDMIFAAVNVDGTQPFTYQWYQGTTQLTDDGVKYSGSTSSSLIVSNLVPGDAGNYYLVVTNSVGSASNLVDVLAVQYQLPAIDPGNEPQSVTTFVGLSTSLTVTPTGGYQPLNFQWYEVGSGQLAENGGPNNEYTGTQTPTLNISPAATIDTGSYYAVISNAGGSVTSTVATVTVLIPPPASYVSYSNQVYTQNFDSLPDPGASSVNSFNNPFDPGSINGVAYSLANPFDFAYPVITSSYVGGLGLGSTMSGWYGAADTLPGSGTTPDGFSRFGAQDGDQTTGGVIDFGPNDNGSDLGTNRALGLLSTKTTGSTTFALKLINNSVQALNYAYISFTGELWRQSSGARTMTFGYTNDPTATNFLLTSESISNATLVGDLAFSFPPAGNGSAVDGTLPANQTNLAATNLQLVSPWQPGAALWLIWSIEYYGAGSGNGYAIDNLRFLASANPIVVANAPLQLDVLNYVPGTGMSFSFTNVPGASFTVYCATNLTAPINWQAIGSPNEISSGSYKFTDAGATNRSRFYQVRSNP